MTMTELEFVLQKSFDLSREIFGPKKTLALQKIFDVVDEEELRAELIKKLAVDLAKCAQTRKAEWPELTKSLNRKRKPVGVQEFLENPYYLNLRGQIYPEVMKCMIELNSGRYVEAVLTGAIGTAKTTIALWTTAYQLYLLSCLKTPQLAYGLDRSSEILFVFQSISAAKAVKLNYGRFRELVNGSPFFQEKFQYRTDIVSELIFPNRIIVRPISGESTAAIGENVIGGIIDELNFMSVIENSKNSDDGSGLYDQAVSNYNAIARRRKSRFMQHGKLAGILCLVSSRRYPGQFTDIKEEEAKTDKTIYVYDKRVWDIKPETFTGETFKVFVGDFARQPRVLELDEAEEYPDEDRHLLMDIPIEYRAEFNRDLIMAIRDIGGVATQAKNPYIINTDKVAEAFGTTTSILSAEYTDFTNDRLMIYRDRFKAAQYPRFVHVDLGVSSDSAGVACGYCKGFKEFKREGGTEFLPEIVFDFVLEVKPPKNDQIKFFKIRELIYKARELGLPIRWVSFDSYQSTDSLQLLQQQGFITGLVSVDRTRAPYDMTKDALLDGRVFLPTHTKALREFVSLEEVPKTKKIDHPPVGSKDCADAIAGVVFNLTRRREVWHMFKLGQHQIPESIQKYVRAVRENTE